MLLDLYDLSNLLIVRFVQFVTHCLISHLKLIDLLFCYTLHYLSHCSISCISLDQSNLLDIAASFLIHIDRYVSCD